MIDITTLGIDLAKDVFQLHGTDKNGNKVFTRRLSRNKLPAFIANLHSCTIGMEACGGAHHWARTFRDMGHDVKLMAPKFVKPYVKTNKNDAADAEAIAEAVTRPTMRFVGIKEIAHQDIQSVHRYRERLIKNRTQLTNHIRGLLHEYGFTMAKGLSSIKRNLLEILSIEDHPSLTSMNRELFFDAYNELLDLNKRIDKYTDKLEQLSVKNEESKKLLSIPGIGPITATALLAAVGNPFVFNKGRQMSAYFGLVPKHKASGNKTKILGISKRGDRYIRSLLIHGARAVVKTAAKKKDQRSLWIQDLVSRCGYNKTVVAVANKNARIAWAVMTNEKFYDENFLLEETAH
jgi:transposase